MVITLIIDTVNVKVILVVAVVDVAAVIFVGERQVLVICILSFFFAPLPSHINIACF